MNVSLFDIDGFRDASASCRRMELSGAVLSRFGSVGLQGGFFFLLVSGGTVSVSDMHRPYRLSDGHLLVLTPSLATSLSAVSADFSATCLYLKPDFFDSLSAGQLVYNQVSRFTGSSQLPLFSLRPDHAAFLCQIFSLFSGRLDAMQFYQDGAMRHLCSFLLLQIADMLSVLNEDTSVYLKHSHEIFRNFKKLLVYHYRSRHTIGFYAASLHISPAYLSRIVKHTTGRTVCAHISELLYADARKMLESTDLSIKEIAEALGFSDQSVFGKFFIRKSGLSPLSFRTRAHSTGSEKQSAEES